MLPERYKEGTKEGEKVGAETEAWIRYRYYMHFTEGSLMPFLVMGLVLSGAVPLFPYLSQTAT